MPPASTPSLHSNSALEQWLAISIGNWAKRYADADIAIFPVHGIVNGKCTCKKADCSNAGKHPACKNGLKDATVDIAQLGELFHFRADLNIGLATGKPSGMFVLDVDSKDGISGEDSLRDLQDEYGMLPPTLTCTTGRGRHLYFKLPDFDVKNATSIAPCLDIRGTGGYTIVPPSKHKSGAEYKWDNNVEAANASEWLLEKMKPQAKQKSQEQSTIVYDNEPDLKEAMWAIQAVPSEDYDTWINMGMALQHAFGDSGFSTWDNWSSRSSKYNRPEMRGKWRSFKNEGITIASLYDAARLHGWRPDPTEYEAVDTSTVDKFVQNISKPKEIAHKLDFNPLDLPGLIGDTVREIVKYALQPQPELALLNTLAFAGAVFGRKYASPINTRTNLYVIGIARTAGGKDHSRQYIANIAELAGLMHCMGAHYIRSDTGMLCDVMDKPSQLMMVDEMGMYLEAISNQRAPSHIRNVSAVLTKLYTSSGTFYDHGQTADRKLRPLVIQRPNLCLYGTTTESKYVKALRTEAIESGELNRFLVFNSDRHFTGDEPEPPTREISEDIVNAWEEYSTTKSLSGMVALADVPPEPITVEWDEECKTLQRFYYKKQMQIINTDTPTSLLWGRYMESIVKITMIFAIARSSVYPRFSPEDFKIAANIVDVCLGYMASLATNQMAASDYESDQQRVVVYLKKASGWVSRNDLMTFLRGIERKKREDLVYDLVEQNIIEEYIEPARADGSKAGRKASKYRLKKQ